MQLITGFIAQTIFVNGLIKQGIEFYVRPKVTTSISYFGTHADKQFLTDIFLEGLLAFGDHLGTIFLQVNEKISPKKKMNCLTTANTSKRLSIFC